MTDQRFKVLIFHYHVRHTPLCFLNQRKQAGDVKRLGGKGFSAAGIAVASLRNMAAERTSYHA